jgi:hypothetical protein
LTVVDASSLREGAVETRSKVLVVARDPSSNPTHPNVVSVPTQRIPDALYHSLEGDLRSPSKRGQMLGLEAARVVDSQLDDSHDPLVFAVESVLARKLGFADALERDQVSYEAGLHTLIQGAAMYDNLADVDLYEGIDMLSVVVALADPQRLLQQRTGSYSEIAWTSVGGLLASIDSRDPGDLEVGFDPIELCVHGVCLEAASVTLRCLLNAAPSGTSTLPSAA